jgi:DNA-binding NtrC family response regulator
LRERSPAGTARSAGLRRRPWPISSRYDWPRNVRELEEAVEHACVVAAGSEIQGTDLPDLVQRGGGSTRPEGPNPLSRCPIARATGPDVH